MKGPVLLSHRLYHITMNGAYAFHRKERAVQLIDEPFHCLPVSSHHAVPGGIYDEEVDSRFSLKGIPHLLR